MTLKETGVGGVRAVGLDYSGLKRCISINQYFSSG